MTWACVKVALAAALAAVPSSQPHPFQDVAKVLLSPRCRNCHPRGDSPLQHDGGSAHAMNISRRSERSGLLCAACHRDRNAPGLGAPPGAPRWHLPPAEMPMVFEGRSPRELCLQLKDPRQNGGKSLAQLVHHVAHDPLVLWGWAPGPTRTPPPLAHATFVRRFQDWVDFGATCPEDQRK